LLLWTQIRKWHRLFARACGAVDGEMKSRMEHGTTPAEAKSQKEIMKLYLAWVHTKSKKWYWNMHFIKIDF
jgi:hypothetical protein